MYSTVDIHGTNIRLKNNLLKYIYYFEIDKSILLFFRLEIIGAVAMNTELKVHLLAVDLRKHFEHVLTYQLLGHRLKLSSFISIQTSK